MVTAELSIGSEAFEKLREDFEKILNGTITNMKEKGSEAASLTMKLDIELEKTFAPVNLPDGSSTMRDVYIPRFAHKVSSVMQIKSQLSGAFNKECEIFWDDAVQKYILVPLDGGQLTLTGEVERREHTPYEYDEEDFEKCL